MPQVAVIITCCIYMMASARAARTASNAGSKDQRA